MTRKAKAAGPHGAASKTDVNISVADDHLNRIHEVEGDLKAAGLDVTQVMPSIGIITGSVAAGRYPELARVRGVSAVEKSQEYQLPPPESDIQ